MRERPKIDLGLTGYDEMFMNDQERAENRLPKIYDISLDEIDDFPDHPFKVRLDEDMDQLVESVKSRGVITPVTLRQKEDGRYEIVSGHRRKKACELAGLNTVLVRKITQIGKENQLDMMKLNAQIFVKWLKEVISENNLQELFFIWDEFTKFFKTPIQDLTGFQEILEVSATNNLCLKRI